ncbi:MAG TPA: type II toxin-antitoxin system HipA family toxin YjjJ [Thermoleophilia bacterium]|nr:type II toxin-antitoxin system HipA family toxin YjjJ [Thermoleophilia bacterium]
MATTVDLLEYLAFAGVARPAALRAELRVSPQTLSRLVAEAGEDVYRIGKGRATQYARTRSLERFGRSLPAFRVDETGEVTPAGALRLLWGHRTSWERSGASKLFTGLPPALADMAPQGYLGHGFSARFPDLRLPPRISDWSDDHRLIALALRGEDCVGDLIVGDESLRRYFARPPDDVGPEEYPSLAARSATEIVGSSAGGEQPKFGACSRGRNVLVKFASGLDTGAARRWRDLLWCEWKALETVAAARRPASRAQCLDVDGWRFLEVERFDRAGLRGRRAVLSLAAVNNEYLGSPDTWTAAAPLLLGAPFSLPEADAAQLRWLDVFGQLIGNTDRHFGNVAFFVGSGGTLRLAPSYDMLPMILAPAAEVVVTRQFEPAPPSGSTLDVWQDAATWAQRFWCEVRDHGDLEADVRTFAAHAASAISALAGRIAPVPHPGHQRFPQGKGEPW